MIIFYQNIHDLNFNSINFFFVLAAFIKQLLSDVFWEDVDYLIVDTPPGTSDEHITVMENIK